VLIVGADRTVHAVRFPVTDIPDAVRWALARATRARATLER
jgi:hypothetical protein